MRPTIRLRPQRRRAKVDFQLLRDAIELLARSVRLERVDEELDGDKVKAVSDGLNETLPWEREIRLQGPARQHTRRAAHAGRRRVEFFPEDRPLAQRLTEAELFLELEGGDQEAPPPTSSPGCACPRHR
jgi:hypothetical protein